MKVTNDIYDEINTIDELISALNQLKEKHGGETKLRGLSIINMGMGDNGFNEFETNHYLDICTYYEGFSNTITLCVTGKCDFLQEQEQKMNLEK